MKQSTENRKAVWSVIAQIPYGKVATYGQIATLAEIPGHARFVGHLLANLPHGSSLPWHRVVNGGGRITNPNFLAQAARLEDENVSCRDNRVSLKMHHWKL
ncbi:MAG: MGMT family protein [Pseudomonadota bacterium]|nr:MGMT family protein [Pseudomonadota bacterium]